MNINREILGTRIGIQSILIVLCTMLDNTFLFELVTSSNSLMLRFRELLNDVLKTRVSANDQTQETKEDDSNVSSCEENAFPRRFDLPESANLDESWERNAQSSQTERTEQ